MFVRTNNLVGKKVRLVREVANEVGYFTVGSILEVKEQRRPGVYMLTDGEQTILSYKEWFEEIE